MMRFLLRCAPLALLLALIGCGRVPGTTTLVSVTADDKVEKYDLYVRDEATKAILLHTDWSDATLGGSRDISTSPIRLGIRLPQDGSYGLVLIGVAGPTDGPRPAIGSKQFFWAKIVSAVGDEAIDAKLLHVPDGDDKDRDLFPDAVDWVAHVADAGPSGQNIPPALLDCDDKMDFPLKKVTADKVNPFATEICGDGIDENCDGDADEVCADRDNDGDPDPTDCAPDDPKIHHPQTDPMSAHYDPYPEAPNCCGYSLGKMGPDADKDFSADKLCHKGTCGDGVDQDCDAADTACVRDQDCDTFPASAKQDNGCMAPANAPPGFDCDDCNPGVNPNSPEICDGKDNNCNGLIDEGCVACDLDGDGFQRKDAKNNCPDAAYMMSGKPVDCNDEDSGVFPESTKFAGGTLIPRLSGQTCNGSEGGSVVCALRATCRNKQPDSTPQDADCNGMAHDGCPAMNDADGDGYPTPADCDDADPHTFPGAPDFCGDAKAQNCLQDTPCTMDSDGDKYNVTDDCNDNDKNVHPWGTELCNGRDDDCDGLKDEGNPDETGAPMVKNSQVLHCTDSDVGACAQPQGDCVCSTVAIDTLHFDFVKRTSCPGETQAIDTGANKGDADARCYFAAQPSPQLCTGNPNTQKDDDCDGRLDAPNGMNADGTPIPVVGAGTRCWPAAVGQCLPNLGGKVIGCMIAPMNQSSNCYQAFGVNPWWLCDNTAICPVAEKCNGFDDDCNSSIPVNEQDLDGDGYMQCGSTSNMYDHAQVCEPMRKTVNNVVLGCGDCADTVGTSPGIGGAPVDHKNIHPTMSDLCNSLDDDCDPATADGKSDCPGPKPANICCGSTGCKNPANDVANCNGCGVTCVEANATPQCSMSACGVQSCNAGYADCNTLPVDGCEISLKIDANNCNACNAVCSNNNMATRTCAAGSCNGNCNANFADCNNNKLTDGCEISLLTDANNCSLCGTVCSNNNMATRTCAAGNCNGTCNANFADCNNNKQVDGCEISLLTDANNCSVCGTICSNNNMATRTCGAGVCNGMCAANFADCNVNKQSDGCEVALLTDPNNCAACGNICSNNHMATRTCAVGACNGACAALFADCNANKLVDGCETPTNTLANCAGCGNVCDVSNAASGSCNGFTCAYVCKAGFGDCVAGAPDLNGCETDLTTTLASCGSCGRGCNATQVAALTCAGSVCTSTCNAGFGNCSLPVAPAADDGCETNLLTSTVSCGTCGRGCNNNQVSALACAGGLCTSVCNGGFGNCSHPVAPALDDGCETNLTNNTSSCGSCGRGCNNTQVAALTCLGNLCTSTCNAGFGNCSLPVAPGADDGCETNLTTSIASCGTCGRGCSNTQVAVLACAGSLCTSTCNAPFGNCNFPIAPAADDGCETNLNTNTSSCGTCGRACNNKNTSSLTCFAGSCTSACAAGFGNCTFPIAPAADDGCETILTNNTASCGTCGRACNNTQVSVLSCAAGLCNSTCNAGFGNCVEPVGPALDDGCETNLNSSTASCGTCGRACNNTQVSVLACAAGLCTSTCGVGFGNCNQPIAPAADDGCETNLTNNTSSCGTCGRGCNGTQVNVLACAGSLCTSTCQAGFGNCTKPVAPAADDGCETNVAGDTANCGSCGRTCNNTHVSVLSCSASLCNSTCSAGFGNCTEPVAPSLDDGCETSLDTSTASCGSCGRACSNTNTTALTCAAGLCTPSCGAGFADCSEPVAPSADDGCETNIKTSTVSCGACGRGCSATQVASLVCAASLCTSTCNSGFGNCNQPVAPAVDDGCETNLNTSNTNCGSCGNNCTVLAANKVCVAGACGCNSDGDCGGATPKCNGGSHLCVACLTDVDCSPAAPVCSVSNTCGGCTVGVDTTCSTPGWGALCVAGAPNNCTCVADGDCTNARALHCGAAMAGVCGCGMSGPCPVGKTCSSAMGNATCN